MGFFKKKEIPPPPPPGMELPPMPEDLPEMSDPKLGSKLGYKEDSIGEINDMSRVDTSFDNIDNDNFDSSDLDLPPLPDEMPELPPLSNNMSNMGNMRRNKETNRDMKPLPDMPTPPKPMEDVYDNASNNIGNTPREIPNLSNDIPESIPMSNIPKHMMSSENRKEDINNDLDDNFEDMDSDMSERDIQKNKYGIPQIMNLDTSEESKEISESYESEPTPMPTKPIFVNMKDYQYVINSAHNIKDKIEEVEEIILKINEIKNVEEKAFDKWRRHLEDLEKKMSYVDSLIAKAEG